MKSTYFDKLSFDLTFKKEELTNIQINQPCLYFLFHEKGDLLYIGITKNPSRRLHLHFNGHTNTHRFQHLFFSCSLIFEKDELKREALEYFLIEKLKPPCNIPERSWRFGQKYNYNNPLIFCNFKKGKDEKCNSVAQSNGYCTDHQIEGVIPNT